MNSPRQPSRGDRRHVLLALGVALVTRGYLGVSIQDLNKDLAQSFGMDDTDGVLIPGVAPGTPAEKAGLKSGDVIIEFDGKAVSETGQLRNLVAGTPVGSKVTVTIIRDKKRREITVKLSELTSHALASADDSEVLEQLGFTVQDFSEELADQLGYEGQEGVRKQMV